MGRESQSGATFLHDGQTCRVGTKRSSGECRAEGLRPDTSCADNEGTTIRQTPVRGVLRSKRALRMALVVALPFPTLGAPVRTHG
jgi:hypothetical protein